ncbi:MAG: hypothetical protein ACP5OK_07940 [Thermoprotei archaeon]
MRLLIGIFKSFGVKVKRIGGIPRSSIYKITNRQNMDNSEQALIEMIKKIAYDFPFYGYRIILVALRGEDLTLIKRNIQDL